MAADIQIHEHQSEYLGPVQNFDESMDAPEKRTRLDIVGTLRRRWLMVLLVWLVPAVPAVIVVQKFVKPTYTATGMVEVAPVEQKILYDDSPQQGHFFDAYLRTQAEAMLGTDVLIRALGTLRERHPDMTILQAADPLLAVRKQSRADTMPRSFLISLAVTSENPEEAKKLAQAILDAYKILNVDEEEIKRRERKQTLEFEKQRLAQDLETSSNLIATLSSTYGAASESEFTVIREARESELLDLKRVHREAKESVIRLQHELAALENPATGTHPALPAEGFVQRNQFIENDAVVRSIRQREAEVASRLQNLLSRLSEKHEEVVRTREDLTRLQTKLDEEQTRASDDYDKRLEERQAQRIKDQQAVLRAQLANAVADRDRLQAEINDRSEEVLEMGQVGVRIQELKSDHERNQKRFDVVDEELRKLEIEKHRPSRITVPSQPEIRPGGINDPRMKLTAMSVGGTLCFALALALIREQRDHGLHETEQLKQIEGIPFLGAVPALRDLEEGVVGQDDFAESYRAIRTALGGKSRGRRDKSFLVTSARSGEGKTSLAVSLAISFTEPGHRVLLIDGDTQVPNASRVLKVKPPYGLRDALCGDRAARECVVPSGIAQLDVLVCQANGKALAGVLDSRTAENVLDALGDSYDYIIIDSPPALSAADALIWATVADGVVMSSFIGETDRVAMQMTCERLDAVGARIVGSVAANVPRNSRFYSYSTTSYERQQQHGNARDPQHPMLIAHTIDNRTDEA